MCVCWWGTNSCEGGDGRGERREEGEEGGTDVGAGVGAGLDVVCG